VELYPGSLKSERAGLPEDRPRSQVHRFDTLLYSVFGPKQEGQVFRRPVMGEKRYVVPRLSGEGSGWVAGKRSTRCGP
jgi:hypothetical protein